MEIQRQYSNIISKIRGAGLRPTRQRIALASLLFDGDDRHVTAEILHAEAQRDNIRVSLATVYNTLHQFTEANLLREIVVNSQRCYFDTNVSDHHHFYHEESNRLEDIPFGEIELAALPQPPEGARISGVQVVVHLAA